jgi:hypothetical protein
MQPQLSDMNLADREKHLERANAITEAKRQEQFNREEHRWDLIEKKE